MCGYGSSHCATFLLYCVSTSPKCDTSLFIFVENIVNATLWQSQGSRRMTICLNHKILIFKFSKFYSWHWSSLPLFQRPDVKNSIQHCWPEQSYKLNCVWLSHTFLNWSKSYQEYQIYFIDWINHYAPVSLNYAQHHNTLLYWWWKFYWWSKQEIHSLNMCTREHFSFPFEYTW